MPDILDCLRAEGLTVIEVNDWRTRGRTTQGPWGPRGGVNHHTANPNQGVAPSLRLCIEGNAAIAGPFANVLQSRQSDENGRDVIYLIADGVANHAGAGGWQGLRGNAVVFGNEVEHAGYTWEPFPEARYDTAVRVQAAACRCWGFSPDMVCQHREWNPTGKTDFVAAYINGDQFRADVAARLAVVEPPQPPIPIVIERIDVDHVDQIDVVITCDGNGNGFNDIVGLSRRQVLGAPLYNGTAGDPEHPKLLYDMPPIRVECYDYNDRLRIELVGGAPRGSYMFQVSKAVDD